VSAHAAEEGIRARLQVVALRACRSRAWSGNAQAVHRWKMQQTKRHKPAAHIQTASKEIPYCPHNWWRFNALVAPSEKEVMS